MENHIHKWEWNKYCECALQCAECKKVIGPAEILTLVEAAQQSAQADECPECGGAKYVLANDGNAIKCMPCNGTGVIS